MTRAARRLSMAVAAAALVASVPSRDARADVTTCSVYCTGGLVECMNTWTAGECRTIWYASCMSSCNVF